MGNNIEDFYNFGFKFKEKKEKDIIKNINVKKTEAEALSRDGDYLKFASAMELLSQEIEKLEEKIKEKKDEIIKIERAIFDNNIDDTITKKIRLENELKLLEIEKIELSNKRSDLIELN